MKNFKAPRKALTGLDAETVAALITASADIALVLDSAGKILDVACGSEEFSRELGEELIGKDLIDTVSSDSKPKITLLLADAADPTAGARQINHVSPGGTIPLSYTLRKLGNQPYSIVFGRDLRALASLQQRLIEAEQSLERDYSRLRLAEARYRLLTQSIRDGVLVIDAGNQRILEANPQAERLFASTTQRLVGKPMGEFLAEESRAAFADWVVLLRRAGRAEELIVNVGADGVRARLSGAPFRQENASNIMLRMDLLGESAVPSAQSGLVAERLQQLVQALPDALVLTTPEGRVIAANRAFLDMAQLASDEQVRNESLDRWLGRPGVDLGVLLANLRQAGSVRVFATTLRGEYGATADVEISAVSLSESVEPCLGFAIRNVDRRRGTAGKVTRELPRSVEQLTELVGRVSLKELVRETTDVIERLCIEAALDLTGDNRASAAEMLGLSRQSLYVKLRRYGLGDL